MISGTNAAILFEPTSYDIQVAKVMGRNVAGATFLEGFVRHAEVDRYVGLTIGNDAGGIFRRRIAQITEGDPARSARRVDTLAPNSLEALASVGALYLPDPQIARFAEDRRRLDQRAYSLCGITHTISSTGAMALLCDVLTAPVQAWDAIIFTSKSVRDAGLRQIEHHADYLEQRIGARPVNPIQTPIIPLGVDVARFDRLSRDGAARSSLRNRIGAADEDVVLLFFGRLVFHAKAHPVPMYLGLERAARRLAAKGVRLHLVQTGHFPNQAAEDSYRDGAAQFCKSVAVHFLDGSDPALADASWAAADIFVSLSDNIQESFGITPVEAMAAGLPCVVSDWDGYRDTVVDGETGIRVPTWMPPAGTGAGFADSYGRGSITYDLYIGFTSQATAVDVPAFAAAVEALATDPERRRSMGEAGRRRAREVYDWSRLIGQYQALWADLEARRRAAAEIAPSTWTARNSRLTDPFDVFAGHASVTGTIDTELRIDPEGPAVAELLALKCNTFAANALVDADGMMALVEAVRGGAGTVRACLERIPPEQRVRAVRTLGWLLKYGVLNLGNGRGNGS